MDSDEQLLHHWIKGTIVVGYKHSIQIILICIAINSVRKYFFIIIINIFNFQYLLNKR